MTRKALSNKIHEMTGDEAIDPEARIAALDAEAEKEK
jgi:hypothetical protein